MEWKLLNEGTTGLPSVSGHAISVVKDDSNNILNYYACIYGGVCEGNESENSQLSNTVYLYDSCNLFLN